MTVVGVDVGGTKVLAGVVEPSGAVARVVRRSTPGRLASVGATEDAVVSAVVEAAGGAPIDAVGVSAAGFVDAAGERVAFAPHLPWRGEAVRARLEDRCGAPVVLDNDANAAAWAEYTLGAARGADTAVVVTLGTGIGGGLVVGGRLHRGSGGMAGEFGHAQVVPDGRPCECGGRGCWEQYTSGNALLRHARAAVGTSAGPLAALCDGDPAALTGPLVTRAAAEGDDVALHAFEEVGSWLGVGVANLVAALDPDVVVIGGGLVAAGDLLLAPARTALRRSLVGASYRTVPDLRPAALGPEAGMVGAALLASRPERTR
ncbi:ROK family protein [uncultured Nocardioides sp.]|uniref:ROK family protein n=1 Tax=uncultured Nocardioides sp. TaxID=198441 RepID=UPI00261B690C|nr:ROK family protein [uncultured Nocardioides sp.]